MRRYTFPLSPLTVIVPVLCLCLVGSSANADPPLEDWCCEWQVGDVNLSGAIDITDLSVLIDNLFLTLTPLQCWGEADVNLDYTVDIADLQAFLVFIAFCDFGNGPGGSCFDYCPPPPLTGNMLPLGECKTEAALDSGEVTADESCISWEWDGESRLTIQHINAGLNCCPEGEAVVTVFGNQLTIDERGIDGVCDCYCLFDVEMQVNNMTARICEVVVREAIPGNPGDPLVFTIDLVGQPTGMVCVDRNQYPWGTY